MEGAKPPARRPHGPASGCSPSGSPRKDGHHREQENSVDAFGDQDRLRSLSVADQAGQVTSKSRSERTLVRVLRAGPVLQQDFG